METVNINIERKIIKLILLLVLLLFLVDLFIPCVDSQYGYLNFVNFCAKKPCGG